MTKKTKKVGITGKYGTRYGSSLRKIIKKFEISQHSKFFNPFTGSFSLKRQAVGIWRCSSTGMQIAGGAWEVNTPAALTAKQAMLRVKKLKEEANVDVTETKAKKQATKQTEQQKEKKVTDATKKPKAAATKKQ